MRTLRWTLTPLFLVLLAGCMVVGPATTEIEPDILEQIGKGEKPQDDPPLPPLDVSGLSPEEAAAARIYHQYNRGVVNITSFVRRLGALGAPSYERGTGSGSLLDQEGHVLTNFHVIRGAEVVAVTFYDGSEYRAEVVGFDPENDLAVLKIDPEGRRLTTIPMAPAGEVTVGQRVYALGSPFGLERTLTTGIVSAMNRPLGSRRGFVLQDLIQTDAAINPGNSGGPLLDGRGRMIGINTAIISPGGGSVGIGFAVSVGTAHRVLPDLLEFGKVIRGWIEIEPVPVMPILVRLGDLPVEQGVIVSRVQEGGNADQAGLRGGDQRILLGFLSEPVYVGGDIIVSVGGKRVGTLGEYLAALEDTRPGETVDLEVVRNGQRTLVTVTLTERPSRAPSQTP